MAGRPSFLGAVVYLDTKVLDKITAEMRPKASAIVNKYGLAIASEAARRAPVATMESSGYVGGALRNSILSESHMEGDMTFVVSDGVSYGVWQEFGTSRMAAQPFLTPAVESWREKFLAAFAELFV